jgi:hypothetical protein
MAVAGLVLGIVAIVLSFVPCVGIVAIAPGVLAVILAAVGLSQSKKTGKGKGMATAGIICGIIACVWAPIYTFVIVAAAAKAGGSQMVEEMNRQMQQIQTQQMPAPAPAPAPTPAPAEGTD